jgi:hypothetical protein
MACLTDSVLGSTDAPSVSTKLLNVDPEVEVEALVEVVVEDSAVAVVVEVTVAEEVDTVG